MKVNNSAACENRRRTSCATAFGHQRRRYRRKSGGDRRIRRAETKQGGKRERWDSRRARYVDCTLQGGRARVNGRRTGNQRMETHGRTPDLCTGRRPHHHPQSHTDKLLQTTYTGGGFSPCSFLCRYFRLSVVIRKASPMAMGTKTADATLELWSHPASWRPLKIYPTSPLR